MRCMQIGIVGWLRLSFVCADIVMSIAMQVPVCMVEMPIIASQDRRQMHNGSASETMKKAKCSTHIHRLRFATPGMLARLPYWPA